MRIIRPLILWGVGGLVYVIIEVIWRGHTHWTMGVLGGLCFLLIGAINEILPWDMPIWYQMLIGAGMVTVAELVAGLILNVWLGMGIWDYSGMPGNFMGQICPQYFAAWIGLSLPGIVLDDWLRRWLFREELPRYNWTLKWNYKFA